MTGCKRKRATDKVWKRKRENVNLSLSLLHTLKKIQKDRVVIHYQSLSHADKRACAINDSSYFRLLTSSLNPASQVASTIASSFTLPSSTACSGKKKTESRRTSLDQDPEPVRNPITEKLLTLGQFSRNSGIGTSGNFEFPRSTWVNDDPLNEVLRITIYLLLSSLSPPVIKHLCSLFS